MDTFEESAMEKAPTITCKCLIYLARPEGFEPPTYRFVVCHSIQLSYGRTIKCNLYYFITNYSQRQEKQITLNLCCAQFLPY